MVSQNKKRWTGDLGQDIGYAAFPEPDCEDFAGNVQV
jgi:hypothetical protein